MGKSSYKKFKKQEKAKVKLKGNKTILPKGQNVTNTNFKVMKIVVKEQLKKHSELELLTRKHLSVKELMSRLSHHNASMRQEALSGLRELMSVHGADVVRPHLSPLLNATLAFMVDREVDVRSDTLKLLSAIFEKVAEEELSPLFPTVVSHLICGMTHIEPSVRADSLRLLDTLLAALPALTATHTATLLPHFLDLISQRGSDGDSSHARTLSLNLDSRVTSEKWRGRVIGRLNRLFSVILDHRSTDEAKKVQHMAWRSAQATYLGLYSPLFTNNREGKDIRNLSVQEYATALMPLLLDAFVEAVPQQEEDESHSTCMVGVDTAALLQSIVEVVLHIWNLLKQSPQPESSTKWFVRTWGEAVMTRFVRGRFPYSIKAANSRKRQRECDKMLVALQVSREPSCSLLNLQLCLTVFLFSPPGELWNQSIQYMKRSVRSLQPEESAVLTECLEAASNLSTPADMPSLLSILAKCDILSNSDRPVNRKAFGFLTSVALKPFHPLHTDEHFTTWLDSLPALLCQPLVPLSTVRSIANIATRNLPVFTNSLDGWAEEILSNLGTVTVTGDRSGEGRQLIAGLLYWVRDWDTELCESLSQLITQGGLGPKLTCHLVDVLRFKIASTEEVELKKMLEEILPK